MSYRSHPYCGGQGIYIRYLSKALQAAGHAVDVVSGPPYPHLEKGIGLVKIPGLDLYSKGLNSLRLRHLGSSANIVEWLSKLSGGFAEPLAFGSRAAAFLRHRHYDVIHDNQSFSHGVLSLQKRGLPVVATIHHPITRDLEIALAAARDWKQRLLLRRWYAFLGMQKRVARRLRHILAVSQCARQDTIEAFGVKPERISVIPNGIDSEQFRPLPEIERDPFLIMAVSSSDQPLKGLALLLEATALLRHRYPALRLRVVGALRKGGPTEQLLQRLQLNSCVHFTGNIDTQELARCYAGASVVVIPSMYEGFGLPAGEAMACGAAVVALRAGALPEVVGDAGVLVPHREPSLLANAIGALLNDPQQRERYGRMGRARIVKHFSWQQAAEQTVECYRRTIHNAHR